MQVARGTSDLGEFLQLAYAATPNVAVLLWPTQEEVKAGHSTAGSDYIESACHELNIPCIPLLSRVQAEMSSGTNLYRDNIHPNQEGQTLIATALLDYLNKNKN